MKKIIALFLLPSFYCTSQVYYPKIVVNYSDAKIIVDNNQVALGSTELRIKRNTCLNVDIVKDGFKTVHLDLCNKIMMPDPLPLYKIELKEDDMLVNSVSSEKANIDFTIPISSKYNEQSAWKALSMIVTSYFDVIEISDKDSGYLRTAWTMSRFSEKKSRTRVIIKLANLEPLTYKIKICSELSSDVSSHQVSSDDGFNEWSRIPKKFEPLIEELQTRLGQK